jgi:hypothetical protein
MRQSDDDSFYKQAAIEREMDRFFLDFLFIGLSGTVDTYVNGSNMGNGPSQIRGLLFIN